MQKVIETVKCSKCPDGTLELVGKINGLPAPGYTPSTIYMAFCNNEECDFEVHPHASKNHVTNVINKAAEQKKLDELVEDYIVVQKMNARQDSQAGREYLEMLQNKMGKLYRKIHIDYGYF